MKCFFLPLLLFTLSIYATSLAENIVVKVTNDKGQPVANADVVAVLKSGALEVAKLDPADGQHKCQHTEECVKIYAAAPNHEGEVKKYPGTAGPVAVTLRPSATKSSLITRKTGVIPGVDGLIIPVFDSSGHTWLSATKFNIQSNGRTVPILQVSLNHQVDAVTPAGKKFKITVVDASAEASLLEYTVPK